MNTKIFVALVIGIALVGLTGAASAATYYGDVAYSHTDILDTESPTAIDVDSGAFFETIIDHFDNSYGFNVSNVGLGGEPTPPPPPPLDNGTADPGGPVDVGAGVHNTMYTIPVGMGVEHQLATQGGSAAITIRSLDSEDDLPEVEADVRSEQSLWYSGSFTEYMILTSDRGGAGAYGLLSNGLDFDDPGVMDDCGNIFLTSQSMGDGYTYIMEAADTTVTGGGAKITGGTFSVATHEGMTAILEGVSAGDAIINVYGGAMGVSTFEGAVDDWEGISTTITAAEDLTVDTGWDADYLACWPYLP